MTLGQNVPKLDALHLMDGIEGLRSLPKHSVDMHDYEKTQATLRLMNELAKGRKSGEEKGWLTLEAVEEHLGITHE